jgi:hypothetical protein
MTKRRAGNESAIAAAIGAASSTSRSGEIPQSVADLVLWRCAFLLAYNGYPDELADLLADQKTPMDVAVRVDLANLVRKCALWRNGEATDLAESERAMIKWRYEALLAAGVPDRKSKPKSIDELFRLRTEVPAGVREYMAEHDTFTTKEGGRKYLSADRIDHIVTPRRPKPHTDKQVKVAKKK